MTKQPTQTTLIIPCTDDGGVGKTTNLVLISDYLKSKDQKLALFDCDTSNFGKPSCFSHWFGGKTNKLDLRDEGDLDSLLSQSAGSGAAWAIADLPANSSGDIVNWLKTVATPKAIERSKGDVVVLIACENITFRILLQQRRGRPARLNSRVSVLIKRFFASKGDWPLGGRLRGRRAFA